ncbi:integrase family protein [Sulfitobacter sp. F26169L]|uniref:tyrosine-type recombinase/integrase n=1 Tax=Sulfitobacter sp. F26169L TaxID=2996015 RepID=UPI002260F8B4|nr:integrase family protein [Sulfitobacter sp. F26169L]MCX7567136.1 integrase family protein [Sulfitobacter sp. F26169L]
MARVELTDKFIKGRKVETRTDFTDAKSAGLILNVYPSGQKTFSFRLRGPDGNRQRANIGHYGNISLSEARVSAADLRKRLKAGENITAAAQKAAEAKAAALLAEIPTLQLLVEEYEEIMAPKRKTWKPTVNGKASEARRRIERVFQSHLLSPVTEIGLEDLAHSMNTYVPRSGKGTANGQVSRARSYLMTMFDWAAHRNKFHKIGLGRRRKLDLVDVRQTYDPSIDDHSITGERDRALDHLELARVLPLLVWPAPECLGLKTLPIYDLRAVSLKFLLLTAARLSEMVDMKWKDYREQVGIWHKPYVKTISGPPKQQSLPLSDAAIALLQGLPNYDTRKPDDLVFPNSEGGGLDNWQRINSAIHRESQTSDWHRHDLRRTGATIMKLLGVSPRVIDEILAHNASSKDDGNSQALENYFASTHLLKHVEHPQKVALDKLADALAYIESDSQ